jgi:hypothetical protein
MKYDLVDQRVEQTRRIEGITEERVFIHQKLTAAVPNTSNAVYKVI